MLTLKSYNWIMCKSFGEWFFEKLLEYEKQKKRRVTQTEFAKHIGVSQATLSSWMNETRKPSAEAALKLSIKFNDPEILSILGYSPPEGVAHPSLPPSIKKSLDAAIDEIDREYKARGISELSSPEAVQIAKIILEAHGITVIT